MDSIAVKLKDNVLIYVVEENQYIDSKGVVQYEDLRSFYLCRMINEHPTSETSLIELRDKNTFALLRTFSSLEYVFNWLNTIQKFSISKDGMNIYINKKIDI